MAVDLEIVVIKLVASLVVTSSDNEKVRPKVVANQYGSVSGLRPGASQTEGPYPRKRSRNWRRWAAAREVHVRPQIPITPRNNRPAPCLSLKFQRPLN